MAKIVSQITPQEEEKGFLRKASDFIGTTALGQRIGGMIYGQTKDYDQLGNIIQQMKQTESRVLQAIAQKKATGRDASNLENALNDLQKQISQTTQTYEGLPTGGVTNRQVLGSAIQTGAAAVPLTGVIGKAATASKIPGLATKVGPKLTQLASSGARPFVSSAVEGAIGAGAFGFGQGLTEGKTFGQSVGQGIISAPFGAAGGAALTGAGALVGKGIQRATGLQKVAPELTQQTQQKVTDRVSGLFGFKGQTNKQIMENLYGKGGDATKAANFEWIQSTANRAPNIQVWKSGKKGRIIQEAFDPTKDGIPQFVQAEDAIRNKIGSRINTIFGETNTTHFQQGKSALMDDLAKLQNEKGMLASDRKFIQDFIEQELPRADNISELQEIMSFGYKRLLRNPDVGDTTYRLIKTVDDFTDKFIDNTLKGGTSAELQALRREYAVHKAVKREIEDLLIKNGLDKTTIDTYGLSNMIAGSLFGNVPQFLKGTAFSTVKGLNNLLNKPKRQLNKAFTEYQTIAPAVSASAVTKTKKKISSDEGKIGGKTLAAATAATGAIAAAQIPYTDTYERPEAEASTEVSPANVTFEPVESLKEKAALRESRNWKAKGYNSPYEMDTKTDSVEFGNALGKYQVRELTLAEWSERFLGKLVSKDEFLNSPELQERFFEQAMSRFEREYEVKDWEHALALWHDGWGPTNVNLDRDKLVKEMEKYLAEPTD